MDPSDRTASLMTPAKLAQVASARTPVSPAAYLDRMAADVGHQHVQQLLALGRTLQAGAQASQAASMQPALLHLQHLLKAIDFDLLRRRGWLAGLTGKARTAGAEFAAQVRRADEAAEALADSVAEVAKAHQPHAAAAERALVELELEYRALDKIIDQGARWLQDMRNQLRTRVAIDADSQRQIDEDTARCELLVGRLKALRAAASASQDAMAAVRSAAERRGALTRELRQALADEVKPWQARLAGVAAAAAEGRLDAEAGPLKDLNKALRRRLKQIEADCEQLGEHEGRLQGKLQSMGDLLGAAA